MPAAGLLAAAAAAVRGWQILKQRIALQWAVQLHQMLLLLLLVLCILRGATATAAAAAAARSCPGMRCFIT
jgi:predicted lysophospholipase L1 biosynthesis ABC-type transport system permease subunit